MKYEVTLKEIEIYCMEIEAETEEEALSKAYGLIETDEGRAAHHYDSDGEYEIYSEEDK